MANLLNDNLTVVRIRELPRVSGRVIIVGDVHGCADQLGTLLKQVSFRESEDALVCVGDLVAKGPRSIDVVRSLASRRAVAVMGNHDYTLLQLISQMERGEVPRKLNAKDPMLRLASQFPVDCIEYLKAMPHILRIPQYNVAVVHAGLNPDLPLDHQEMYDLLHARSVVTEADGVRRCSDRLDDGSTPWARLWRGPETIVFGHDARAGLQQEQWAVGIDTGCVYGNPLTAYVLPGGRLVQVPGLTVSPSTTVVSNGTTPTSILPVPGDDDRSVINKLMSTIAGNGCGKLTPAVRPPSPATFTPSPPPPDPVPPLCVETLHALVRAGHVRAALVLLQLPTYADAWAVALRDEKVLSAARYADVEAELVALATSSGEGADDAVEVLREMALSRPKWARLEGLRASDHVPAVRALLKSLRAVNRHT